MKGNPTNNQL